MVCETRMVFPLGSAHIANSIYDALVVDDELQPEKIQKTLSIDGESLVVEFKAPDWRLLRVASTSFIGFLMVAIKCANSFPVMDEPASDLMNPGLPSAAALPTKEKSAPDPTAEA
mmetsp:Transcript_13168/g.44616  ORF Transcript_13168/g.44616 Transcript_13168/m.44616 type:complete len:115 (-) Transcript_13168:223-567(-)